MNIKTVKEILKEQSEIAKISMSKDGGSGYDAWLTRQNKALDLAIGALEIKEMLLACLIDKELITMDFVKVLFDKLVDGGDDD